MAYEKQTWTTGEVITQEKLNHMEDGIASDGVEVIKIGEASGGGNFLASFVNDLAVVSQTWALNGSGNFVNGKTFGEILEDTLKGKKIVNIICEVPNNSQCSIIEACVHCNGQTSNSLIIQQYDPEFFATKNITIHALGMSSDGVVPNGSSLNIYAVCI